MTLTKRERLYKKKLFRYLGVKKKSKQKELTSLIVKNKTYRQGGFELIYITIKDLPKKLAYIFNWLTDVVIEATEAINNLNESIKANYSE